MPRKPVSTVIEQEPAATKANAVALTETANAMAEHSQQIMEAYGEGLPYDRIRIVHEARFYMAQSAEAMLEVGRRLVILKEHEPHGEWINTLQDLGIEPRLAQRSMQVAVRLSNASTSTHLIKAAQGKSKLFELMVLEDEDLAELSEGGTVAGITLDDVEKMPVSQLRKALREAKEDKAAKESVAEANRKRIDELQEQVTRIKKIPIDEQVVKLRASASTYADQVEHNIRAQLSEAFSAVLEFADETGIDQTDYLRSRLDLLDQALIHVRGIVGIERTTPISSKPEWEEV